MLATGLNGCGNPPPPDPHEAMDQVIKAATDKNTMWYRFRFQAEYAGKPFEIDQMVTCVRSVVSGGSLGQSPGSVVLESQPMSAAARMADGSQVLVRIPNMCSRYRKYERLPSSDDRYPKFRGVWGYKPGWKSRGPFSVLPLVIWSDKLPRPDRIESYVARGYYDQDEARMKNPKGILDLWPMGKYPHNYLAVLKQINPLPRYPNPMINPALDPRGPGNGRDGRYHGKGDSYGAFTLVPVANFNAWVRDYADLAREFRRRKSAHEALPDTKGLTLTETWNEPKPLESDPSFNHPQFAAYRDRNPGFASLEAEKSFITSACVSEAVGGLMLGKPGLSDLPYDAEDWGSDVPDRVRLAIYEGARPDMRAKYFGKQALQRNCYAQLGKLKSFDIVDGRLDASRAMPGVIVYHRWYGQPVVSKTPAFSKMFAGSGAVDPATNTHRLRLRGQALDYQIEGPRRSVWRPVIFEDKNDDAWLQVAAYGDVFFAGRGENNDF